MTPDLETLLAPVPGDDPAGPDLAYDPQRHLIEQAFDTPVSIDASGQAADAPDLDWRTIIAAIVAQSARTKDVWLPVYLCRAGARAGDLATVACGAQALAGLLERYWETAHPRLEDYGFAARRGACDTLTSYREFLAPLERLVLVDHARLGRFTAADLIRLARGGETEPGYGPFRAALDEAGLAPLTDAMAHLIALREALRATDRLLMAHAGSDTGTNFAALYAWLDSLEAALRHVLPQDEPEATDAGTEDAEADPAVPAGAGAAAARPGRIGSREDVVRALDAVIGYYRAQEPGSPVPLLLERAKHWVALDFMAVLEDIAPAALADAGALLQSRLGA
ncbi:ImpA family type VI secretion system protein [Sphingomonas morindae]|uniref:Type VI secretion system ImpA family N-terminal domain-containing protein n=1 Tax=Sphingomonas morindae TaxID=1541170 RepID=A0ABY4XDB9_9SPHN|nr:type VI secretion system ImpA family N-terminal domain-containing protein [Sphingomonas morindae]USI74918.1 type VI secretion system ImpA family N-terminal domain-containing protein [Sphingomonas morindae]